MYYQNLMPEKIEQLEREVQELKDRLNKIIGVEKYIFPSQIQIINGRNIQLGETTGTKIGTATTQKIGFLGSTPIAQQTAITAPTGGGTIDAEARTAINTLITTLEDYGFVAPN